MANVHSQDAQSFTFTCVSLHSSLLVQAYVKPDDPVNPVPGSRHHEKTYEDPSDRFRPTDVEDPARLTDAFYRYQQYHSPRVTVTLLALDETSKS